VLVLSACGPKQGGESSTGPIERTDPDRAIARERLESATASLDVTVRRFALVSLSELDGQPAGGDWASRGLWDPEPAVQRAVITSLEARLPEAETSARLQEYVRRDNLSAYARCAAASVLARAGDDSTLPAVQAAIARAEAPWVAAPCALAAAQMGDSDALLTLQGALEGGELPLDMGFLDDLGRSGLSAAAPALESGLALLEDELELAVAAALLELGASSGETILRRALGDNDLVRPFEAIDFLMGADTDAARALLRRAGGGDVGVAAKLALIAHGEGEPYFAVESLLSADREVRALSCRALGGWLQSSDERPRRAERLAREALVQSLYDLEEQVRLEAIRALGTSGQPADASALAPLVVQDDGWQSIVASASLLKLVDAPTGG